MDCKMLLKIQFKKKKERKHFMKEIFYLQLLVLPFDGLLM